MRHVEDGKKTEKCFYYKNPAGFMIKIKKACKAGWL